MYKPLVLLCVVFCVIEARPKWQWLPPRDGYIPVYIRSGDTPLEEINPELAEAFHALPSGRSAGKQLDAAPETPEQADQPATDPEIPEQANQSEKIAKSPEQTDQSEKNAESPEPIDHRPYEKKILEKKTKKATEVTKPVVRR